MQGREPSDMNRLKTILELPETTHAETKVSTSTTIGQLREIKKTLRGPQTGPLVVTALSNGRVVYVPNSSSVSAYKRTVVFRCKDRLHEQNIRWVIDLVRPEERFSSDAGPSHEGREFLESLIWTEALPLSLRVRSSENLASFERELDDFVEQFRAAKVKLGPANRWARIGVRPAIVCDCGNYKEIDGLGPLSGLADPFQAEPRLVCSACGARGKARIVPVMMDGFYPPDANGYKGVGSRERSHSLRSEARDDLVDLHQILSSDGIGDAYLSDGTMITKDGLIY